MIAFATAAKKLLPEGSPSPSWCAAWSRDGTLFAVGGGASFEQVCEATGKQALTYDDIHTREGLAKVFDLKSRKVIMKVWGEAIMTSVMISPDNKYFFCRNLNGSVVTVDLESHLVIDHDQIRRLEQFSGRSASVQDPFGDTLGSTNMSFSNKGERVVTLSSGEQVRWEGNLAKERKFEGTGCGWEGGESSVRVFAVVSNDLWLAVEHAVPVTHVTFSPDARTLATGSKDGMVKLTDVKQGGKQLATMQLDSCPCNIEFSPNSELVAICSVGIVKLVNARDGAPVKVLDEPGILGTCLQCVELLLVALQSMKFAFDDTFPWNAITKPVAKVADFTVLHFHVESEILVLGTLACSLLLCVVFCAGALTTQLHGTGKYLAKLVNVAIVPILTSCLSSMRCESFEARLGIDVPCYSSWHLWTTITIAIIVPVFLWLQIPYCLVGGDTDYITFDKLFHPQSWYSNVVHHAATTAYGIFDRNPEFVLPNTIAELLVKIGLPVFMVFLEKKPQRADTTLNHTCLTAGMLLLVSLQLVVALWLPPFKYGVMNVITSALKSTIVVAFAVGVLAVFDFHNSGQQRLWPAVLYYFIILAIAACAVIRSYDLLKQLLSELEVEDKKKTIDSKADRERAAWAAVRHSQQAGIELLKRRGGPDGPEFTATDEGMRNAEALINAIMAGADTQPLLQNPRNELL